MYVPEKFQVKDQTTIYQLIENNGFATIVSPSLQSTHVPLILDREQQCLVGHMARINPHWREFKNNPEQHLVIFHGAHGYISPTWYQTSPDVPTWNYAAIHIKGTASLLNAEQTEQSLDDLMKKYEPELLAKRTIVTAEYQEKLSKGIVGFRVNIEYINAQAKLGQHRPVSQQQGVAQALEQSTSADHQALFALMKQLKLGLG